MKQYKIKGRVEITYTWDVDEVVEVEDDEDGDDAVQVVLDDLDVTTARDADTDIFGLDVEELDEGGESLAQLREKERALLAAWNSGLPISA